MIQIKFYGIFLEEDMMDRLEKESGGEWEEYHREKHIETKKAKQ